MEEPKQAYLVYVTEGGYEHPALVRAASPEEAQKRAIDRGATQRTCMRYSVATHELSAKALEDALPGMADVAKEIKDVARAYWHAAMENAGDDRTLDAAEQAFEEFWDERGPSYRHT